jgi:O-Antigen ligase
MALPVRNRFPLSRTALVALAEARLVGWAAPEALRQIARIMAWAAASIALGAVLGLAAVILPPMGAFGIVAVVGLVLLWVMPDLPLVSPGLIRKAFLVMLVADLSIPFYYTVQFSGLPWISARRLSTFALIAPFLIAIAASSDVRRQITDRLRASLLIFMCVAGFFTMAALSVLTSINPQGSLSALIDLSLSAYVPFFALLYIARNNQDVVVILRIMCFCAVFNTAAGVIQFIIHRNFFLDIFPVSMLNNLISNNPTLQELLPGVEHFRNGLYRSESTFVSPLSFSEFEIILIPIGIFFAMHRTNLYDRILGWAVVFGGPIGLFCSGSRGGWVGLIASAPVFIGLWSMRKMRSDKTSLAPAIVGLGGLILLGCVIGLLFFSHTMHDSVLGGAAQAGSTQARYDQWAAARPYILANPITGHGFSMGGSIFGDYTIDSYPLSLVLETGVPALLFFAGLCILPIWYGLRNYVSDLTEYDSLGGALACSFIAFVVYSLALSQKENHMLIFLLLAMVIVLNYERFKKQVSQPPNTKTFSRGTSSNYRLSGHSRNDQPRQEHTKVDINAPQRRR